MNRWILKQGINYKQKGTKEMKKNDVEKAFGSTYVKWDKKDSDFVRIENVPEGTYRAVCIAVWSLGECLTEWQGKKKVVYKVRIRWELDHRIEGTETEWDGKRYCINKNYTVSLGDKATLYKDLCSWFGKKLIDEKRIDGFDIHDLCIDKSCLLSISHNQSKNNPEISYANVSAIMPLMKGQEPLEPELVYEEVPQNIKDLIRKNAQEVMEYRLSQEQKEIDADSFNDKVSSTMKQDEIPF